MINSFKLIQIKAETFPYISDLFVQYGRHAVQKGAPKVNELSVHLIFTVSSMGRCNAILNQGGRCYETKNSD